MKPYTLFLLLAASAFAHSDVDDDQISLEVKVKSETPGSRATVKNPETWLSKYGKPSDHPFSGFLSFSHMPYAVCLEDETTGFDIALLGFPFDTAVSYRPGARFGPYAIRSGSRRQRKIRGYTLAWGVNPYDQGVKIIDCGDVGDGTWRRIVEIAYWCGQ